MEAHGRDFEQTTCPGSPDAKRRLQSGARRKVGAVDLAVAARASGAPLAPGAARLTPRVEAARAYAQGEVEIFERSWDPQSGASISRVERWRPGAAGRYDLVEALPCHDSDVEVTVLGPSSRAARPLRTRQHADWLRVDPQTRCALHPARGWQATIRALDAVGASRLPRELIHELGPSPLGFTLRLSLASSPDARQDQLLWLTDAVARLAADARVVWVPFVDRWVPASEWRELAARARAHPRTLLGLWTRVVRSADRWHTRGLSRWMLPELSVEAALPAATSVMRAWMLRLLEHDDARREGGHGPEAPALFDHRFRLYDPSWPTPRPLALRQLASSFRADPFGTEGAWRVRVIPPVDPALASRWGTVHVERARAGC